MGFAFSIGQGSGSSQLRKMLLKHLRVAPTHVATSARQFPITSRIDIQLAVGELLATRPDTRLFGLNLHENAPPPSLANTLGGLGHFEIQVGPLQYEDIDIGTEAPARCLRNGIWLSREEGTPLVVMLTQGGRFGLHSGVQLEIGVPPGELGARLSQGLFRAIEMSIAKGRTYRGRVLSLEAHIHHSGGGSMVKVHRLPKVNQQDVVLPAATLATLERNVTGFLAARPQLRSLHFQLRKGLLFYGPPGTGKTHTIHYLASQLPDHTTLLVTAEQVGLLEEYFRLARFLQPAILVIEDVDLIARERTQMRNPFEESTLNKLLNEMDGLREDAEVLFILTTNRPEQIEPALASRPGRIDQAIEFPLPDDEGREKLTRLYARGLEIPDDLLPTIVSRTKGVSAAFIKELMRRCAQFLIEGSGSKVLTDDAVNAALEEMLLAGGILNRRLLGGEVASQGSYSGAVLRVTTP